MTSPFLGSVLLFLMVSLCHGTEEVVRLIDENHNAAYPLTSNAFTIVNYSQPMMGALFFTVDEEEFMLYIGKRHGNNTLYLTTLPAYNELYNGADPYPQLWFSFINKHLTFGRGAVPGTGILYQSNKTSTREEIEIMNVQTFAGSTWFDIRFSPHHKAGSPKEPATYQQLSPTIEALGVQFFLLIDIFPPVAARFNDVFVDAIGIALVAFAVDLSMGKLLANKHDYHVEANPGVVVWSNWHPVIKAEAVVDVRSSPWSFFVYIINARNTKHY
ncbi:hypothetical protein CAPTEDRAFT_212667 [Capitella teleta]|uniref:Uncharacterized protein n=1 Tax=Capitella teleta TaxID=283909 RepID=R7V5J7_CAPTE|nr:hypothetical protein CAPTEDRAFT_212667 [Capitella teleta]|eukprot:ELU11621.1 hypothetical protein CAPTEDRAFT_212667 [Capitella teleta]